ncbi:hypothetical protein WJX75_008796 [Coccomyxa subellipsoidea]|uniref:TF-B3 domain-containing protein n=1 Tax=Coccomyxa subellipsoidea TaxID=248742 RepID=A0ABR2YK38_9CHLO
MGGFRELAALTANGVNGAATSEALLPSGQLRTLGKRRRAGAGQLQLRAPCADSLEGVRSAYEGFDSAAARWLAVVAEREAGVTVREAACCGVQAQLAARSAELAAREGRLADWDARLRSWDVQLQRLHSQLKDQEERLQMRMQPCARDKENSTPEDTDSDLDVTGGPCDADVHHRGGADWAGAFPGATAWPGALGFHRYWEANTSAAATSPMMEEEQSPQQLQPVGHASPTLHIAPLSCGLRIVKSGRDTAPEDTAAAGRPRAAAGAAASAESPSECSAGAAAIFPDDTPHTNGPRAPQPPASVLGQGTGVFTKNLDYKSCDHIMCLTKNMARHLFPQPPHTSAGGPSQMSVELEDDSGRLWPMTYRCVPHRYSYELRAGWKTFAAFWAVGVGDTVSLWREPSGRLRISVHAVSSMHPAPAAGTRGRPGAAA